jgi:G:T-mismatch repair DNA endonuclease (very short patch repair protein)
MAKFHENVARDAAAASALRRAGWRVFTIWECQVSSKALNRLATAIRSTDRARE